MKVLIVEDNADTRDLLTFFLRRQGYEVIEAEEGEMGLLKAAEQLPALVLTDLGMPGMDGIELIRHLRQGPEFENLKIVAITGHACLYAQAAEWAGADVVVSKPADPYHVAEVIAQLFTPEGAATGLSEAGNCPAAAG